jgi:hypothetical protein
MSGPEQDLVAGEGVDEGSADSVVESGGTPRGTVLGAPPQHGAADGPDAAPEEVETHASRAAYGPGQQQQAGEG